MVERRDRFQIRMRLFPTIQLKQIPVSDRGSLRGLTQFPRAGILARVELAESKRDQRERTRGVGVCDNLCGPLATR